MRRASWCLLLLVCAAVVAGLQSSAGVPKAAAAADATGPLKVVLLGDSYAAGNGGDDYWGPKDCWRSRRNWSERYLDTLRSTRNVRFINRACSGSVLDDISHRRDMDEKDAVVVMAGTVSKDDPAARAKLKQQGQCTSKYSGDEDYDIDAVSALPSLGDTIVTFHCTRFMLAQWNAVGKDTDLVLLSIAGNDIHFADIVKQCFAFGFRDTATCRRLINEGQQDIGGVGTRIGTFLKQLRTKMLPGAKIVLVSYPYLEKNPKYTLRNFRPPPFWDSYAVGREIRKLGDLGDDAQRAAVDDANGSAVLGASTIFLDTVKPHFTGHEPDGRVCCENPLRWVNEFDGLTLKEWYHYNHTGHAEIANLLGQLGAPGGGGVPAGQGSVDIAFVIDTTGSMGGAIASVKAAAVSLVNNVSARTASARFALVDYRDFPQRTGTAIDYPSKLDLDFNSNAATVNGAINALSLGNGGDFPETMYSGIKRALDLDWRPGVKKMVIVLADAPALSPEPFTGLRGVDIVNQALAIDPAEVHFVDVGSATFNAEAQDIATRTNGGIYRTTPSQAAAQIEAAIDQSLDRPDAWAGGPYVGAIGTTFTLDGRGSFGTSSPIVKYEWDVNSDGSYEYVSTAPTTAHAYTQPFDGFVTLRVTDGEGRIGLATAVAYASIDGEEVPDDVDNCPNVSNPGQEDYDGDGIGDKCDPTTGYPTEDQEGIGDTLGLGTAVIAGGQSHSLALMADGTVKAWGLGSSGQLGTGGKLSSSTPVDVTGLTGVTSVSAGDSFSLALRADGTVWAWGDNTHGQIGDGTKSKVFDPVKVTGLEGIVAVSAGSTHSLAVSADGTLWAWGANGSGQIGNGTTVDQVRPVLVSGVSEIVAAAGGGTHTLALRGDGTVFAWGANGQGQLGTGATTTKQPVPVRTQGLDGVIAIAAGFQHSLAVTSAGAVWAWGVNADGQLGNGSKTDRSLPVQISAAGSATAVAAGRDHSLALGADGTVKSWGANSQGQLGDGTTTSRLSPVSVLNVITATAIAAGWSHSLAVLAGGSDHAWGRNDKGQLGDGTTTGRRTPVGVASITTNAQPN